MISIKSYREKELNKLNEVLDLYEKIRNKEELEHEEIKRIKFNVLRNEFLIDNLKYKETKHKLVKKIEWFNLLDKLNFKVHLDIYEVTMDYENNDIETIDIEENITSWITNIDCFIYKENDTVPSLKIGINSNGFHTSDKNNKKRKDIDKCNLLFYIGEYEIMPIKCKGYDIIPEKHTPKIIEKITKSINKEHDPDDLLPEYFCSHKKITKTGKDILNIIIEKYLNIIKHNSSYFI